MAKKVFMIAPFDALTGNLSGDQDLQYADNNNPAYEAPNGTQYARNYRTRYVGARRGKDGLVYFQVKQTSATVLSASSRRNMALIGVTAAIRSSLMATPATWNSINAAFNYLKGRELLPAGQDTFNKWFAANVRDMLTYKRATWAFTQSSISFTVHNPYDLNSSEALVIKQSTWVKFASNFAFAGNLTFRSVYFTIDAMQFMGAATGSDEITIGGSKALSSNVNYSNLLAAITIDAQEPIVMYNGLPVYTAAGEVLSPNDVIEADSKYTTADPNI